MSATDRIVRRHLVFGWWALLLFASLGMALELMHGFKLGFYLSVYNETRRLLWTLAHAHGVLLALVNLAFSWTVYSGLVGERARRVASPLLIAAGVLLPAGFFAGGAVVHGGDPNVSILILPLGAAALLGAAFVTAWELRRERSGED